MSPTDITSHVHEAAIRQRVADWAAAISAKDIDAVASLYAPDVVSFDLTPPLRYAGADGKRRAWQAVFAALSGPIAYEIRDRNITTHGELAFAFSLNHFATTVPTVRSTGGSVGRRASGKSTPSGWSCTTMCRFRQIRCKARLF